MSIRKIDKRFLYVGLVVLLLLIIPLGKSEKQSNNEGVVTNNLEEVINPDDFSGFGPSKEESLRLVEEHEENKNDYPLWNKLPHEGRGYKISKYSSPLTVVVYPMGLDKEVVEKEVRQWIKDNGGDEIRHQIEWR